MNSDAKNFDILKLMPERQVACRWVQLTRDL